VEQRQREQKPSAQLHSIVGSSEDAIISKDLDSVIRSWNYGAEQIYGYSTAEAIGHGGRVKHFGTIRLRKGGAAIHVSLTVSPIRDPRGSIVGISHISREITERKQLEEQIRQTQNWRAWECWPAAWRTTSIIC
jgi:PAS domain-containing protein